MQPNRDLRESAKLQIMFAVKVETELCSKKWICPIYTQMFDGEGSLCATFMKILLLT